MAGRWETFKLFAFVSVLVTKGIFAKRHPARHCSESVPLFVFVERFGREGGEMSAQVAVDEEYRAQAALS